MFSADNPAGRRKRSALLAGKESLHLGYGRFVQTDPIGYGDGLNWYNYVDSDPVNAVDPTGFFNTNCFSATRCATLWNGEEDTGYWLWRPNDAPDEPGTVVARGHLKWISTGQQFDLNSIFEIATWPISFFRDAQGEAISSSEVCVGPRISVGGGVSATGFLAIVGASAGIGIGVSVPKASLGRYSLRGTQVSFNGSVTPMAGLGVFLGAGPNISGGVSTGASGNLSGSITPTVQVGAGDGAGVEVGTDLTSPTGGSVALGRIAGGVYGAIGARFTGMVATNPIGCR